MKRTLIAAALALLATPALADDDMERVRPVTDDLTKKECGACHMAFQPAFLPADSWRRMMNDLDNHFGESAWLPEKDARAIEAYLVENAGRPWHGAGAPPLRITELRWWRHEHREEDEISRAAWEKAGSEANCPACHQQADRGYYDDD